jgi:hypothetical protein
MSSAKFYETSLLKNIIRVPVIQLLLTIMGGCTLIYNLASSTQKEKFINNLTENPTSIIVLLCVGFFAWLAFWVYAGNAYKKTNNEIQYDDCLNYALDEYGVAHKKIYEFIANKVGRVHLIRACSLFSIVDNKIVTQELNIENKIKSYQKSMRLLAVALFTLLGSSFVIVMMNILYLSDLQWNSLYTMILISILCVSSMGQYFFMKKNKYISLQKIKILDVFRFV